MTATGLASGHLHHYWDTVFVEMLGTDVFVVADNLEGHHRTGVTVVEGNADRLGEGIFRGAESACLPCPPRTLKVDIT